MRAQILVQLRERQGPWLTQGELARLAGMDASTISRFERGERSPSLDSIVRLAPAYGLTPTELCHALLEGEAAPPPPPADPMLALRRALAAGPWAVDDQDFIVRFARRLLDCWRRTSDARPNPDAPGG